MRYRMRHAASTLGHPYKKFKQDEYFVWDCIVHVK
mgnify:CR=1 FL=1